MKRQFAKMFDTRVGQIVVIAKDGDDACPELRFFFRPGVLDVGTVWFSFDDTNAGYAERDLTFEGIDEETAIRTVIDTLAELMEDREQSNATTEH